MTFRSHDQFKVSHFFFFLLKSPLVATAAMADKKNAYKYLGGGATIRIGREMLCLPYAEFFYGACTNPVHARHYSFSKHLVGLENQGH